MKREGQIRIPSGCAIAGIIDKTGKTFTGEDIITSIEVMHERSNGLGGGFAAYGIYPEFADQYAFHIFYDSLQAKIECEEFLEETFEIAYLSKIPTKPVKGIEDSPLIWRYFATPLDEKLKSNHCDEDELVVKAVFHINTLIEGAYVFSSGKNMGVFKAVGFPEDVGRFYRLDEYAGWCFTAHGRYPTNTPGWWGGAHPFALLDLSVVHNGDISSYDANRRAIEMHGYTCSLKTDTEAITYIIDYLQRKNGLSPEETASVIAAPFWEEIEAMTPQDKAHHKYLRMMFSSQLITGPFSILVGSQKGLMALNDRLKLRSMVVGEKGEKVYFASEESAINIVEPQCEKIWFPQGGEPVYVAVDQGARV